MFFRILHSILACVMTYNLTLAVLKGDAVMAAFYGFFVAFNLFLGAKNA